MKADLKEKLVRARSSAMLKFPFWGYLIVNLQDRLSERYKTAATDGRYVYWNEHFLRSLPQQDVMFVLCHEALHCVLQHPWRRSYRIPEFWNVACDAVVNDILLDAKEPVQCSADLRATMIHGADRLCAEELYKQIEASIKECKGVLLDEHIEELATSEHAQDEHAQRALQDRWTGVARALERGTMPEGLKQQLLDVTHPRRSWQDLLTEGISFPEDYTWNPTDRRFQSMLLPTLSGSVHRVVFAIDTSGSIDQQMLAGFWTELRAIMRNNHCQARVLSCDAAIHDEWDENEFDPQHITALGGGGGTSFVPVFEKVEQYRAEGWTPEALIYFTDTYGSFPSEAPDYRVIWIAQSASKEGLVVPFGELICL